MKLKKFSFLILTLFLISLPSIALDSHEQLRFVKEFYQIYHFPSQNTPNYETVFNKNKNLLSDELRTALEEDLNAQRKVTGENVGLDFDPFLNGQDPAENYKLGQIRLKDKSAWVEMFEVRERKKASKPSFWVETRLQNSKWVISNFHYPNEGSENSNLHSILKSLKDERQKTKSKK